MFSSCVSILFGLFGLFIFPVVRMKAALCMCHELVCARWTSNSPVLLLLDTFQAVQTSEISCSVEDFGVICESAS